jgi:hypothetical protein
MGCSAIHMFYSRKAAMPHGHGISARGAESRSGSKHEAAAFSRTAACEPAARHHRRAACLNEPPPLERASECSEICEKGRQIRRAPENGAAVKEPDLHGCSF